MSEPEDKPEVEEDSSEAAKPREEGERLKDQMLRLQADFENARKRWIKQQAEIQETANAELVREMLEIYDDFLRALAVRPEQAVCPSTKAPDERRVEGPSESFRAGVEMIARRLEGLLRLYGVEPMEVVGKTFDASRHEAVAHEATEEVPESTVVTELRRGYLMNGKVLRPAIVKVAVKPELET